MPPTSPTKKRSWPLSPLPGRASLLPTAANSSNTPNKTKGAETLCLCAVCHRSWHVTRYGRRGYYLSYLRFFDFSHRLHSPIPSGILHRQNDCVTPRLQPQQAPNEFRYPGWERRWIIHWKHCIGKVGYLSTVSLPRCLFAGGRWQGCPGQRDRGLCVIGGGLCWLPLLLCAPCSDCTG